MENGKSVFFQIQFSILFCLQKLKIDFQFRINPSNFQFSIFNFQLPMLRVYRASAGAGKTFALTMEYFKIVFNVSSEYKNVLAVTFTNKATEEMKSRIVRELNKLAEGQKSDYREELKRTLKLTYDQVRERDRKSTRLNSSHRCTSRMPSSA